MANHSLNKLSARKVATAMRPGRYSDGGGLYLVVTPSSRKWVFIFTLAGKRRAAKALGLIVSPALLARADKVTE